MEKISKAHLKELTKLNQKKYRESTETVLVEGIRLIKQLVANNIHLKELLTTNKQFTKEQYPAENYYYLDKWQMENLSSTKHPQELAALISVKIPSIKKNNYLLYLEDINDPGNLGTIFRTALAADVDGVILSPDCCELTNPKVIRASLGAVFSLPSATQSIDWLIEQDAALISTTSHNAINIFDVTKPIGKKILILGSEAHGICKKVLNSSTIRVKIPLSEKIESLNVAAAAAISIYHFSHVG